MSLEFSTLVSVEEYGSAEDFQVGIDKMRNAGWTLDSWQMVPFRGRIDGIIIVAVFRGR